jgi:hypothetical protein
MQIVCANSFFGLTVSRSVEQKYTAATPAHDQPDHSRDTAMPKRDATITYIAKHKHRQAIAAACQISMDAIKHWKRVPPKRAKIVAQIIGIPCHLIRPDFFPTPEEERSNGKSGKIKRTVNGGRAGRG